MSLIIRSTGAAPRVSLVGCTLACILLLPGTAFAYIDPNTGGYLFQLLFPIIAAIGAGLTFFRDKLKYYFLRLIGRKNSNDRDDAVK